jgi:hypothetical protein
VHNDVLVELVRIEPEADGTFTTFFWDTLRMRWPDPLQATNDDLPLLSTVALSWYRSIHDTAAAVRPRRLYPFAGDPDT